VHRAAPALRIVDDIAEILLPQRLQAPLALILVHRRTDRLRIDRHLQGCAFVTTRMTRRMPSGQAGGLRGTTDDTSHLFSIDGHHDNLQHPA
jgi:hypothetical protein